MHITAVQKVAKCLNVLVLVAMLCNFLVLPMIPGLAYFRGEVETMMRFSHLRAIFAYDFDDGLGNLLGIYLIEVWKDPYTAVLTIFLLFSGLCTARILWQGRRVLNTILWGEPYSMENAVSLRRAAVCAFAIAGAAAVRVLWGIWFYGSIAPLLTYNALFVPIFTMAGLLALVMSALFRQAAELKAENDLTI